MKRGGYPQYVRLDDELAGRLEAKQQAMQRERKSSHVSLSETMREAMIKGLETEEEEDED